MPESRWILWAAGPIRGPAVRFWAILAVAVVLGFVLGLVPHTPLATHAWVLLLIGLTQVSVFAGPADSRGHRGTACSPFPGPPTSRRMSAAGTHILSPIWKSAAGMAPGSASAGSSSSA